MDYSRSPNRSLAGVISDRYADSLETLAVIGDTSLDIDEFYEQTKERDGYPVLVRQRQESRAGCASAVAAMAERLGARVNLHTDEIHTCLKRRLIVHGKVLCRLDDDQLGWSPTDLQPAAAVVLVDYARGVLNEALMERISAKYTGREIIADWHPSRPLDFYRCATALKASWDAPPPPDRPFIRTRGREGLDLYLDGYAHHFPARSQHPLDCCGAGDGVLAALGVGRLLGWDWIKCCELASEVAANVCSHWGSLYAGPRAREFRSPPPGTHPPPGVGAAAG